MLPGRLITTTIRWHKNIYPLARHSSNLPKLQNQSDAVIAPTTRKEPVPQKLLKKINVEYHGIGPSQFNDETKWTPIFRFPYIDVCYTFIRVKVYVTFTTMAISCIKCYQFLIEPTGTLALPAILATFSFGCMIILGNYFRKFICQIYLSEDQEFIRICRFTFFGKRCDMVLPVKTVIPLSEINVSARGLLRMETFKPEVVDLSYDRIEFYDEYFFMLLIFGGVVDKDKFKHALGKIEYVKE